jgi:hypothetical protein
MLTFLSGFVVGLLVTFVGALVVARRWLKIIEKRKNYIRRGRTYVR